MTRQTRIIRGGRDAITIGLNEKYTAMPTTRTCGNKAQVFGNSFPLSEGDDEPLHTLKGELLNILESPNRSMLVRVNDITSSTTESSSMVQGIANSHTPPSAYEKKHPLKQQEKLLRLLGSPYAAEDARDSSLAIAKQTQPGSVLNSAALMASCVSYITGERKDMFELERKQEKKLERLLGSPYAPGPGCVNRTNTIESNKQCTGAHLNPEEDFQYLAATTRLDIEDTERIKEIQEDENSSSSEDEESVVLDALLESDSSSLHSLRGTAICSSPLPHRTAQLERSTPKQTHVSDLTSKTTIGTHNSFKITPPLSAPDIDSGSKVDHTVAKSIEMHRYRGNFVDHQNSSEKQYPLNSPRLVKRSQAVYPHGDGSRFRRKSLSIKPVRPQESALGKTTGTQTGVNGKQATQKQLLSDPSFRVLDRYAHDMLMTVKEDVPVSLQPSKNNTRGAGFYEHSAMEVEDEGGDRPESANSNIRRAHRCGIGPTLRLSKDAEDVIMGFADDKVEDPSMVRSGSTARRESRLTPIPRVSRNVSVRRLANATQLNSARTTMSQRYRSVESSDTVERELLQAPFSARTSSLPNSPEYISFEGRPISTPSPSIIDRLTRPTKASQSRALESQNSLRVQSRSATAVSIPGALKNHPPIPATQISTGNTNFGSTCASGGIHTVRSSLKGRFSAILGGRRRMSTSKEYRSHLSVESMAGSIRTSCIQNTAIRNPESKCGSIHLTTCTDSNSMHESTLINVDSYIESETHSQEVQQNTGLSTAEDGYTLFRPVTDSRQGISTPPPSRGDHSEVMQSDDETTRAIEKDIAGDTIDRAIKESKENFDILVERLPLITDPVIKANLESVLVPLATAIQTTALSRQACLSLELAVGNLAIITGNLGANAARSVSNGQGVAPKVQIEES